MSLAVWHQGGFVSEGGRGEMGEIIREPKAYQLHMLNFPETARDG